MSRRNKPANLRGCKPDGDVCVEHDRPLACRHGCEMAERHSCNARDPVEGDVYAKEDGMRRVIAVKDGRVCYSNGGDSNGWCNLKTFRNWFVGAKIIKEGAVDGTRTS